MRSIVERWVSFQIASSFVRVAASDLPTSLSQAASLVLASAALIVSRAPNDAGFLSWPSAVPVRTRTARVAVNSVFICYLHSQSVARFPGYVVDDHRGPAIHE